MSGLAPGEYYVSVGGGLASPLNPRDKQVQTFYPGTPSETDAQPVTVGLGEVISIAFPLATGRAARISGIIEGMGARPPTVRLERRTLGITTLANVNVALDGRFSASNLVP